MLVGNIYKHDRESIYKTIYNESYEICTTDTKLLTDIKKRGNVIGKLDRKHSGGIMTYRSSRLRVLEWDKK